MNTEFWITLCIVQFIGGILLWRKYKFDWHDSIMFSSLVVPNIILLFLVVDEFIRSYISFARNKLYNRGNIKDTLEKMHEAHEKFIKCTGNNGEGCFMDSCGINCGCEGLKEFGEKLKNKIT